MRRWDGLVVNESSQTNLSLQTSLCTHLWHGEPAFNATFLIEQDSHTGACRGGRCDTIFQIYYRYATPLQGACLSTQAILLLTWCPPLPISHQNEWVTQLKPPPPNQTHKLLRGRGERIFTLLWNAQVAKMFSGFEFVALFERNSFSGRMQQQIQAHTS